MKLTPPSPSKIPSIILTLSDTDMELNRGSDGLIHIVLKPTDMPGVWIDVPWREEDLRVMVSAWIAGLRGPDNGQTDTP